MRLTKTLLVLSVIGLTFSTVAEASWCCKGDAEDDAAKKGRKQRGKKGTKAEEKAPAKDADLVTSPPTDAAKPTASTGDSGAVPPTDAGK